METQQKRTIKGNDKPEPLQYAALRVAQGLIESEAKQVDAIKKMADWYPPLADLVEYAPGLRYGGKVTKRWKRFFIKIYPCYIEFALPAYRKIGQPDYAPKYPKLTHPQRVWKFMNEIFSEIVEAVNAKLYELLMELKVQVELDTKSEERKAFLTALTTQEEKKYSRVSSEIEDAIHEELIRRKKQ